MDLLVGTRVVVAMAYVRARAVMCERTRAQEEAGDAGRALPHSNYSVLPLSPTLLFCLSSSRFPRHTTRTCSSPCAPSSTRWSSPPPPRRRTASVAARRRAGSTSRARAARGHARRARNVPTPSACPRVHGCRMAMHTHVLCVRAPLACAGVLGGRRLHTRLHAAVACATPHQHRSTAHPAPCPPPPTGTRPPAATPPRTRSAQRYASSCPAPLRVRRVVPSVALVVPHRTGQGRVGGCVGGRVGRHAGGGGGGVHVRTHACARGEAGEAGRAAQQLLIAAPLPTSPFSPSSSRFPSPRHNTRTCSSPCAPSSTRSSSPPPRPSWGR